MKSILKLGLLVALLAATLALFPPTLHAQWVYVNDNNGNLNANTVTGFMNIPVPVLAPIPGSPWATAGTGLANYFAVKNQAMWTLGVPPGKACLFISDPAPSTGFPAGDIAVFTITTATGALAPAVPPRYASPGANSGNLAGIPLAAGGKTLYAAYTATNTIVVWRITWNGANCILNFATQIAAVGLSGGFVDGMSEARNFRTLVVAYADGSVQSFTTPGNGIAAAPCPAPIPTTGFTTGNGGIAAGVDITADSLFAIFGDASAVTELETVRLPITCATVTKDFGGPAVASATNLGPGVNSNNVWLSPNGRFIYVANNSSGQVTSVAYNEGPNTMALAGPCSPFFTNPTTLKNPSAFWVFDAGIQTSTTAGTGARLYVAEFGAPSSVALLRVDPFGCTQEVPASPFIDPSSNYVANNWGALSLNAWPPRLF